MSDVVGTLEHFEPFQRGANHVIRIGRAERFSQDVMDAGELQHGTRGTTGNNSGTFGGRTQHDPTCTEDTNDAVRNGTIFERDFNQIFLGIVDALANGFGNFGGLAETDTDFAFAVADDDERTEGETTTALDDFGDAVNEDNLLLEFGSFRFETWHEVTSFALEFETGFASGLSESGDATVENVTAAVEDDFADTVVESFFRDSLTDSFGSFDVATFAGKIFIERAGGKECDAFIVVDNLSVDVRERAEDVEPRTLSSTGDAIANAKVPLATQFIFVGFVEHDRTSFVCRFWVLGFGF